MLLQCVYLFAPAEDDACVEYQHVEAPRKRANAIGAGDDGCEVREFEHHRGCATFHFGARIESFVPREEVDEIYLDESFYIVPDGEAAYEAFAVIREAMKKTEMVGLGRVVMHRRERLLMLEPRDKGIQATALRYKPEVRDEDTYFNEIPSVKVTSDMLALAEHILRQKKGHFEPDKFEDRYEDALSALIKAKRAGKEPPAAPEPKPSNVINLMDALRRSVGEKGGKSREGARRKSSGGRTSAKKKTAKHKRLKKAS